MLWSVVKTSLITGFCVGVVACVLINKIPLDEEEQQMSVKERAKRKVEKAIDEVQMIASIAVISYAHAKAYSTHSHRQ